jgi:NAD(P)-dependent dehydrogenase (short-subunit alcohol dehydrogenase family)
MTQRSAVITGGASGIGEACARRLARDGHRVWLLDINEEAAGHVAASIRTDGGEAHVLGVDVADLDAMETCAATVAEASGAPDALVTAAGILQNPSTVADMDMAIHDRLWRVNYHGTVHTCRAFGKLMSEARKGAIVTVGSINSFAALPLPAYCPSKTAILRLTEILAVELGRHHVRVNGIAPTYVLTPALEQRIAAGERDPDLIRNAGAIEMFVTPAHIASVVAFLCSQEAAAVTGVMMPVDAGWCAVTPYRSFAGGLPWS